MTDVRIQKQVTTNYVIEYKSGDGSLQTTTLEDAPRQLLRDALLVTIKELEEAEKQILSLQDALE